MTYQKYLQDLENNYDIHLLAYVEEHILFSTFLSDAIRNDQRINDDEKKELLNMMTKAYKRLEQKFKNSQENRAVCLKKHDELQEKNPRVSNYYKIIASLFYDIHPNEDPSSELTSFALFFMLLNDIDDDYPKQFHNMVIEKKIVIE